MRGDAPLAGSAMEKNYLAIRAAEILAHFRDRDLLVRPLGVMPSYCINEANLDRVYDAIEEAFDRFRSGDEPR